MICRGAKRREGTKKGRGDRKRKDKGAEEKKGRNGKEGKRKRKGGTVGRGVWGRDVPLPNRLGGLEERNFGMIHPRDVQPDRRTDGRAIAHSALSIYAICCCALKMIHKCTTSSIQ